MKKVKPMLWKASVTLMLVLGSWNALRAQSKQVTIEWDYTYTAGLSCRYPMTVEIYYYTTDPNIYYSFGIFRHPSYSGSQGLPNLASQKYHRFTLPSGVSITTMRFLAGYVNNQGLCPGASGLCYENNYRNINRNESNPCLWTETTRSPTFCGFSDLKIRVNIAPAGGAPISQLSPVKASYCPGETITYEVPCNMKGQGFTYNWYYREGTGATTFFKTTTAETVTVGAGYDLTPKAGVNTFLSVRAVTNYSLSSAVSSSFRYGAHAPVATVEALPPKCADGNDWSIKLTGVSSADAVVTSFKANIFHSTNTTSIPDGFVTFTGSSGTLTTSNIVSSRVFAPGTVFTMRVQNDFDPTNYGTCETTLSSTYTIPNKAKISILENSGGHSDLTCHNVLTGALQVNVSHGDGNYTVLLDNVAKTIKAGSPAHQPIIEGLDGGAYSVKVKDTHCETVPITITLTEPAKLTATIEVEKSLDCSYSNDGQLKVNVGGGLAPYTINWSNGATTATATNLSKGPYNVSVKDLGCPAITDDETLSAPDPIVITLTDTPPTCAESVNGRMRVSNLQNAPGTITYSWNTGETSQEIFNLGAGSYSVTVTSTDAGKVCSALETKALTIPQRWTATLEPQLTFNGYAVSCQGEEDGRIDALVKNESGQVVDADYYTWSTGANGAGKKFIDQLGASAYSLTIRYKGVCETIANTTLYEPDLFEASITPAILYNGQTLRCHNGSDASLQVTTLGGTGLPANFNYDWSTGATTSTVSGLGVGAYDVTVNDANGCPAKAVYTVINPDPVSIELVNTSNFTGFGVSCAGLSDGHITTSASGGTQSFTYSWSNGKKTPVIDKLAAGVYTLTLTDTNGCSDLENYTITAPAPVTLAIETQKDIDCYNGEDGSIELKASGGTMVYQYSSDNSTWQALPVFAGLTAKSYTLYARDQNRCAKNINTTLDQPAALGIQFTDVTEAFCADPVGTATALVSGGVGSYNYTWTPNGQSTVLSTSDRLQGVSAGVYRLALTDGNDCLLEQTVPITSTDGAKTVYSATDASCYEKADGKADISILSGNGPFSVQWPDGQSTLEGLNLLRGSYDVVIKDVHQCAVVQTVVIQAPDPLAINVPEQAIPSCFEGCDGTITLAATGGSGGYVFQGKNLSGTQLQNLCTGTYEVILKDVNGCETSRQITLGQPEKVTVVVQQLVPPTCHNGCDGLMEVIAKGGNGSYQYQWLSGSSTAVNTNLCAGQYKVNITDSKGCPGEGTFEIPETEALTVDLGEDVTLCVGQRYTLDAGNQWASVKWSSNNGFNGTGSSVTVKEPGQYMVKVFSAEGCEATDDFLLETSLDLLKAHFLMSSEGIVSDTVVMIDVSWPLPETIEWSFPREMKKLLDVGDAVYGKFAEAGQYEVSLTVRLGECVDRIAKSITISAPVEESLEGRLGYEEFLLAFEVYPSPNDGHFDVGIELKEESPVTLSVWSSVQGRSHGKVTLDGASNYRRQVDFRPLSPGTYVLRLDHAKGKKHIRFIVH